MVESANNVGIGLYSFSEAARLLRKNAQSVRRWANGYTYELRVGKGRGGPVLGRRHDEETLSFGELIELLHVRAFASRAFLWRRSGRRRPRCAKSG